MLYASAGNISLANSMPSARLDVSNSVKPALKSIALPDGTMAPVMPHAAIKSVGAPRDTNLSATVFPAGYWQKVARSNSAVVATQTFASGLVRTSRVFTNQTGNALIHVPVRGKTAAPMVAVPQKQPYSWQSYWVPADGFQPEPTFNSDWQGFAAGTYQFQVIYDFGVWNWRTLGQFTLTDPVDETISEGFDVPVGPPQNFLPMGNGNVRVVKTP